jgi:hypothetical protein
MTTGTDKSGALARRDFYSLRADAKVRVAAACRVLLRLLALENPVR